MRETRYGLLLSLIFFEIRVHIVYKCNSCSSYLDRSFQRLAAYSGPLDGSKGQDTVRPEVSKRSKMREY